MALPALLLFIRLVYDLVKNPDFSSCRYATRAARACHAVGSVERLDSFHVDVSLKTPLAANQK